jgi:hypothetical protein
MQNPDRVAQPSIHKSTEAWAQFMHRQLYQYQNAAGLILDQHQVSLSYVRGMLLMHQQVPAGLFQKQKHGLYLHLAEVFTTPGLYRQIWERLHIFPAIHCEHQPMSNVTNNLTLKDVMRHLTSIRVSDAKVWEAYHYGVG